MMVCIPPCSCESGIAMGKLLKQQQLMQFLMGFNEVYVMMRGSIFMLKPLPSLGQAYSMILQEEK